MAESLFGAGISLLGNALEGASQAQTAIANNLANVNTPGYQRTEVSFKQALAASMGTPTTPGRLPLTVDDPRQIPLGGQTAAVPFAPKRVVDTTTQMRADGSNVDPDEEMARLSESGMYTNSVSQYMEVAFMHLREAIQEKF